MVTDSHGCIEGLSLVEHRAACQRLASMIHGNRSSKICSANSQRGRSIPKVVVLSIPSEILVKNPHRLPRRDLPELRLYPRRYQEET